MPVAALPTEIIVLALSVVLLFAHISLQSILMTMELGRDYNTSARDEQRQVTNVHAARSERALRNLLETYAAFIALALALAVTGKTGGLGAWGAGLWFSARVLYVLLYVAGIPYIRTLVWIAATIGLVMMLVRLVA